MLGLVGIELGRRDINQTLELVEPEIPAFMHKCKSSVDKDNGTVCFLLTRDLEVVWTYNGPQGYLSEPIPGQN